MAACPKKGARHGKWIWEQEGRARIHLGIAPLNGNRNGHSITSMDPLKVTNKMIRLSQYVYIDPDDPPQSIEMELIFNRTTVRPGLGRHDEAAQSRASV